MRLPIASYLLALYLSHFSMGETVEGQNTTEEKCSTRTPHKASFSKANKVLGYYPAYNHRFQSPQELNYALYTDVIFFTAMPNADLSFTYPNQLEVSEAERLAKEFVEQAAKHHVNTLIAFGGWTGSRFFSRLTSSDHSRQTFAKALVDYAQKLGFGGIDIDWEYPNSDGSGCNSKDPRDTVNLGKLLKEIRKLWPEAQLTAALNVQGLLGQSGGPATVEEVAEIVANLDFANLMAYDFYGNWAMTSGPLAAIRNKCADPASAQSVETGVAALTTQGFKHDKIVLGIPGYARSYDLSSPKLVPKVVDGITSYYYQNHSAIAPRGGKTDDPPRIDECGTAQSWAGIFLVRELISEGWLSKDQKKGGNGFTRYFDQCSGEPFLTNGTKLISYDDKFSSVAKAKLASSLGLGGVFFFDTLGPPDSTVQESRKAL